MQLGQLVAMANQIGDYFAAEPDRNEAVAATANHLRRYWDPRMRKQIIAQYDAPGAGLNPIARDAVALLAEQAATGNPTSQTPNPKSQATT